MTKYTLPELGYSYDALEPFIDARTMEIHHSKHHQTYVDKLNAALEKHPEITEQSLETLLADLSLVPEDTRMAVRNHGGGVFNHSFFWKILKVGTNLESNAPLLKAQIEKDFGSFDAFTEQFSQAALNHFGSGWAWLVMDAGTLKVISSANQDCPLSSGLKPIFCIDVWEHAYYLNYQNKRADYIKAFWSVLNWEQAEKNFTAIA